MFNLFNCVDIDVNVLQAADLNAPIGVWQTSAATALPCMFDSAGTFNQNIDSWQMGSVAA